MHASIPTALLSFFHLVFSPFLFLSMFSLLYSFLPPLLFMATLFLFILSAIIEFTPFAPQPFLASCGHLSKTAH